MNTHKEHTISHHRVGRGIRVDHLTVGANPDDASDQAAHQIPTEDIGLDTHAHRPNANDREFALTQQADIDLQVLDATAELSVLQAFDTHHLDTCGDDHVERIGHQIAPLQREVGDGHGHP